MKILAAINNDSISRQLKKVYKERYNEDLDIKDVYYFKSLMEEVQKNSYDRVIILEELEQPATQNVEVINKKMFDMIDKVSDDSSNSSIIFIASDKRKKNENFIISLFNIGVYNILLDNDRTVDNLISLINKPRTKKQAKDYIDVKSDFDGYKQGEEIDSTELSRILMSFDNAKMSQDPNLYVDIFNKIVDQYTDVQLKSIIAYLTEDIRLVLYEKSSKFRQVLNLASQTTEPPQNEEYVQTEIPAKQPVKEVVKEVVREVVREVPVKQIVKEEVVINQNYSMPTDYNKVIAFMGASCVGKTFVLNAVAENLAKRGLQVAILDMTMNKDEYFVYAINSNNSREDAIKSIDFLIKGEDKPLKKGNISIYTGLPNKPLGEKVDYIKMIDIAKLSHSVVLIDTDELTPVDFLKIADTIYLVQDMDMLGIQPITDYLKQIKYKNVNLKKLKIVINKYIKSSLTPKRIIESLSYYSNAEMTIYDELFDDTIPYYIVPFDIENYKTYIEGLLDCRVNYGKFTDELKRAIDEVANGLYNKGNKPKKSLNLFK